MAPPPNQPRDRAAPRSARVAVPLRVVPSPCLLLFTPFALSLFLFLLLLLFAVASGIAPARAHPSLGSLLSHQLLLRAGTNHIEVELELVFGESASYAERRRMDRNRNGRIDASEVRYYVRSLAPEWEGGLDLTLARPAPNQPPPAPLPIPLTLLHNPELDLRENPEVALAGHALRLQVFARTPPELGPGSRLVLTNELWAHLPAVRSLVCSGRDGFALEVEPTPPDATPAVLVVRCLAAPNGPRSRQLPPSGHRSLP